MLYALPFAMRELQRTNHAHLEQVVAVRYCDLDIEVARRGVCCR